MVNMDYISARANALVRKYGTRDPFAICRGLGIHIRYKDLGQDIKAYFFCQSRIRNIVINQRTAQPLHKILCGHELGHGVLHKELAAMRGFHELALFDSASPAEYEANLFASELLIDDDELLKRLEGGDRSFFSIAKALYIPPELLDFKLRVLKNKGHHIEPPYMSQADFLKNELAGCYGTSEY